MIHETILLNRIYKTNEFAKIKPRIVQDRLIFVLVVNPPQKLGTTLTNEQEGDEIVSHDELLEYFDISEAD